MRTLRALSLATLILSPAHAFAAAPCQVSAQTATFLDEVLSASTIAEIKADGAVRNEALNNVLEILNGDECMNFLGKAKAKALAGMLVQQKQASASTKSAAIIGNFLSQQ